MESVRQEPSDAAAPDPAAAAGAPAASPAPAEQGVPPRPRGRGTARDMVLSMIVILAVVGVVVVLLPRPSAVQQPPVDVRSAARAAARELPFAPLVPTGLPEGWKPTSAYSDRSTDDVLTWHIGYLTPAGDYAAVEVAKPATARWVSAQTASATPTEAGSRQVGGVRWLELYREDRDRSTLLREDGGETTLVTGGADFAELEVLASAVLAGERVIPAATPSAS
ncbi:DUF4245 domain-containing protein [Kineococcus glutinatus]|uniref:DUF4245 domain-containing protein n=1 Tax=Kineococcus glutinatus TaxID=1070872 RepID=UPI0031F08E6E